MSRAEFQLEMAAGDGLTEVTVKGEVDASNIVEFNRSVRDLPGDRPVVLQLSSVKYLDSAGFSALDRLLADDEILIVLAPNSFMYRVAELMCMPIHHDTKAARKALRNGAG
ncbi:STAS domain-containing protein [Candidatus Mycobacterium wuenschmannii]|uniref:STAS domain-containing protein n=1 Tax=Candidatus Mycobacterium wuenschmannii TaxID=3027808 RepID=A0ABY8VW45_9MYCO|nr:STAS domain-containing protein [Candidatus Mycobacterium wuenschmannii]WIM87235.1 STAS domain-containing protein [Candidatus Mycobacterium wuenschmannii]